MSKPKVYIIINIEDDLEAQLRAACDAEYIDYGMPRDQFLAAIHDAEGILLSPRVRADKAFFDAAPKLKVISTSSVGYDPFDISEATKHGVVVCHTPGVLTDAVANLTMAFILNVALRLFDNEAFVRSGGWARREKAPPLGNDIQGKTLGVIGYGRIGQEVTKRMQALGMKTLWYDVFDTPHPAAPKSERRSLDDLLVESDFVTLHTNLDANSRHLISTAELARMKPTAYLTSTRRAVRWWIRWPSQRRCRMASLPVRVWMCWMPSRPPSAIPSTPCPMSSASPTLAQRRKRPGALCASWRWRIYWLCWQAKCRLHPSIPKRWGRR